MSPKFRTAHYHIILILYLIQRINEIPLLTIVIFCYNNLWQRVYALFTSWWMSLFNINCKRLQMCKSCLKKQTIKSHFCCSQYILKYCLKDCTKLSKSGKRWLVPFRSLQKLKQKDY